MSICAAWLLKHAATSLPLSRSRSKAAGFYERAVQLDPILLLLGRGFLAWTLFFTLTESILTAARGEAAKRALENAQKLAPNSTETLLALGYHQLWCCMITGCQNHVRRASKMLPGNSEVRKALGAITRREGHWDQSIAWFEEAPGPGFHVTWSYDEHGTDLHRSLRQFSGQR